MLVTNLGNGNVDRTTELHQLKTNYQVLLTTTITSHHPIQGQKDNDNEDNDNKDNDNEDNDNEDNDNEDNNNKIEN